MKKLLILILALLLCTSCLFACQNASNSETESEGGATNNGSNTSRLPAQDTTGEGFELALAEDKLSYIFVSTGTCSDERVVIPATYKELPISAIASGAFSGSSKITEIVISEGITSIESEAFSYSKGLKKVTVANSVKSIGEKAFFNCDALESVALGNGVASIGASAFEGCSALTEIIVPDSVNTLGSSVFYGCTALSAVSLGKGLSSIGHSAFFGTALYGTPANWTDGMLYCGSNLLAVNDDCEGAITVKDGTVLIADQASTRAKFSSVTLPSSLKYIGSYAFTACMELTSLDIPNGVVSIGYGAFSSCDGLVSVTLPNSLTFMDAYAFYHCSALTAIVIPEGITAIPAHAFDECASLRSIKLHNKLTEIGKYGFANCYSLVTIEFPNSLTVIRESAFYKCYNLVTVTIPASVTTVEGWAFQHCQKLVDVKNESSIAVTKGVTDNGYLGYYAKSVHNGESILVKENGYIFFVEGNTNYLLGYDGPATELQLPADFNGESYVIYKYAFSFRYDLESVVIPSGATEIKNNVFETCKSLTEITLGTDVKTIQKNAFLSCNALSTVHYLGSESEFNSISVKTPNDPFINATKVFN